MSEQQPRVPLAVEARGDSAGPTGWRLRAVRLTMAIRRALPLVGVLTAGMLVGAVAGSALLNPDWFLLGFLVGMFVSLGGIYVISGRDLRFGWGFTAVGLAILVNVAFLHGASKVVLELRGEPIRATVAAVRDGFEGKGEPTRRFRLVEAGGVPIRGELTLSRDVELGVGDEVSVLRDAAGLAHPVPADEQVAGSTGAMVFFWLLVAVPALISGRPPRYPSGAAANPGQSRVVETARRRKRDRPRSKRR
ncbi:hypothetical protein [Micromonospora sp. L31]|uniref:hypothetical protein n=1 Tax=Micromonospora sp. L31 TaxID=3452213 RepID=UPI003F8A4839